MTRISLILLPVAAFLFTACDSPEAVESDEPNENAVQAAHEDGPPRGGKWLAKLDTDKDGAISSSEAAGHHIAEKFAELDTDKDGKLTREELAVLKGKGHGRGGHHKDPAERAAHMLEKLDADRNGSLSQSEVGDHGFLAAKFADIDADKNGQLGKDELAAFKGHHGKGEGRGHGGWHKKDPAERAAHALEKFDADKDGSLSPAEVEGRKFADKFGEIDTDKNGKLSKDELTTFKAAHPGKHGGKHGDKHGDRGDRGDRGGTQANG